MDKEILIKTTKDLYKLTVLFPKKEPLRYKLREAAVRILEKPTEADFGIIDSFLEVAKFQNWVRFADILTIQENYVNLKELFRTSLVKEPAEPKVKKIVIPEVEAAISDKSGKSTRQGKIIDFLKKNEKTQVWQVKQIFPRVSKRTLRRDFESLLRQGVIQRIGERNNTFYQIKTA